MTDQKKVIKGLACCTRPGNCVTCPWNHSREIGATCIRTLMKDTLALLKAQKPRVMTLEEVKIADVVFLEFQDVITTRIVDTWFGNGDGDIRLVGMDGTLCMAKAAYNDSWRCWTSRPTEEQRKAVTRE